MSDVDLSVGQLETPARNIMICDISDSSREEMQNFLVQFWHAAFITSTV